MVQSSRVLMVRVLIAPRAQSSVGSGPKALMVSELGTLLPFKRVISVS